MHAIGGKLAMRVLAPFVPAVRLNYGRKSTVATFHRAGAPILAGTDSNDDLTAPCQVTHGESLHEELERLVDAGLTGRGAARRDLARGQHLRPGGPGCHRAGTPGGPRAG